MSWLENSGSWPHRIQIRRRSVYREKPANSTATSSAAGTIANPLKVVVPGPKAEVLVWPGRAYAGDYCIAS